MLSLGSNVLVVRSGLRRDVTCWAEQAENMYVRMIEFGWPAG
uniref:Uncharacterized protein n=1 Tax=Arundo donax TaxID=35708 RepID=A0A0A8YEF3_ARUDO